MRKFEIASDVQSSAAAARPTFLNPLLPFDCPDPSVVRQVEWPQAFFLVCTGGAFPIRASQDLIEWTDTGVELLPGGLAPWAGDGQRNWAPEIHAVPGGYVAYYTASGRDGRLAIGVATAPRRSARGVIATIRHELGAIDATHFADGDRHYLYWKVDGNAFGLPTPIFVRELTADGLGFAPGSTPRVVLTNRRRARSVAREGLPGNDHVEPEVHTAAPDRANPATKPVAPR